MTEVDHTQHHAKRATRVTRAMRGHGGHGDHVAQFRRLFWIMLVLAIPTVALSGMFAMILGYTVPDFPGARWVSPVLGTVMYLWGGRPFLTGAISEIRSRAPGMMLLIGLAITVAFVASWGASLGVLPHDLDFWWELALLIVIMLLGHWIEMRSLAQTTSALDSLAALLPDEAERVVGDGDRDGRTVGAARRRRRDRAARRQRARRRRDRRRRRRDRRVDGDRRIPPRAPQRRATPSSQAPSPPTPGCGSR